MVAPIQYEPLLPGLGSQCQICGSALDKPDECGLHPQPGRYKVACGDTHPSRIFFVERREHTIVLLLHSTELVMERHLGVLGCLSAR